MHLQISISTQSLYLILYLLVLAQVMNLQLTEEVEKLENMLKLQSSINKDLHKVK